MIALVLNVGSTTLKFACIDTQTNRRLTDGTVDRIGQTGGDAHDHSAAVEKVLEQHRPFQIDVIGHRIVHGGESFQQPTLATPDVLRALACLDRLAPLHNPAARKVVEDIAQSRPSLNQVMVFDTAFFASLPPEAYRYALPESAYVQHGVRRYGMHGTSHRYVIEQARGYLQDARKDLNEPLRIISLHLGGGASATASVGGVAVDTSMGMTPLEGLVMATRCGDVDPSVPLFLMEEMGMDLGQMRDLLNKSSGMLGLCGDADMRTILNRRQQGDTAASLAIDIYIHRLVKTVGAYAAVMGGVDAIVFTAGVGENAPQIRSLTCARLSYLGVSLNEERNGLAVGSKQVCDVSLESAKVVSLVVPTDEEVAIARYAVQAIT